MTDMRRCNSDCEHYHPLGLSHVGQCSYKFDVLVKPEELCRYKLPPPKELGLDKKLSHITYDDSL